MKITAQEEYGLRCLLQLARAPQGQLVTVREIAAKEGLSSPYVEKLLRVLAKGGLVHGVRGTKGGYVMNRSATSVTLGDIVRVLGRLPTTDHICRSFTGNQDECVHFSDCGIRSVWAGLTGYLQKFLDETTVASLLEKEYTVSERLATRMGRGR